MQTDGIETLHAPRLGPAILCESPQSIIELNTSLTLEPIAIDTERSLGKNYHAHAELIQLKQEKQQTYIIDVPASDDALHHLAENLEQCLWIVHAAEGDLPCLRALGLNCSQLFDTELAGRFLGYPYVNLAAMTSKLLGINLAKGYAQEDWSLRPVPEAQLLYAALDIELLHELKDALTEQLHSTNKIAWFEEECTYMLSKSYPRPRKFMWRKFITNYRYIKEKHKPLLHAFWTVRENCAYELNVHPELLLNNNTLAQWVHTIVGRDSHDLKIIQKSITNLQHKSSIHLDEQSRDLLCEIIELAYNHQELNYSVLGEVVPELAELGTHANSTEGVPAEAVKNRRTTLGKIYTEIGEENSLDLSILVSRKISEAICSLVSAPESYYDFLIEQGMRSWQAQLLNDKLTNQFEV